jgi:hypothetical protein
MMPFQRALPINIGRIGTTETQPDIAGALAPIIQGIQQRRQTQAEQQQIDELQDFAARHGVEVPAGLNLQQLTQIVGKVTEQNIESAQLEKDTNTFIANLSAIQRGQPTEGPTGQEAPTEMLAQADTGQVTDTGGILSTLGGIGRQPQQPEFSQAEIQEIRARSLTGQEKPGSVVEDIIARRPGQQEPTPATDIDDFVRDANAENIRLFNKPLTPGERNEARKEIKRAQAKEVQTTQFARRTVDAQTASRIAFNSEKGKALATIETAGAVLKAKGEITPQQKIDRAKIRMEGNLSTLSQHYLDLDSMGAILSTDRNTLENLFAAGSASSVGQAFGRITGSDAQSVRSSINKLKPLILQDIRQSTDMGARGLDSERELDFYLQGATDEKTDIQSNIAAIIVLDEAFGNGQVGEQLRTLTNDSLIQNVRQQGKFILDGGLRKPGQVETPAAPAAIPGDISGLSDEEIKLQLGIQ